MIARRLAAAVAGPVALGAGFLLFTVGALSPGAGTAQAATAAGCAPAVGGTLTGSGQLRWPMPPGSYTVSSPFGPRAGGFHAGIDLAAPDGTPIYAAAAGTVVAAGPASGFGLWIVIDSTVGGQKVSTVYGHMNDPAAQNLLVAVGQAVTAGQQIARVGHNGEATGPHLHFEIWPGGRLTGGQPIDPAGALGTNTTAAAPAAAPPVTVPVPAGGATLTLSAEQSRNAATITGVVKGRNLPLRAAVIAIATAMQESTLRNIAYGDRDSLGLFQQRPSQGWGTPAQILDPVYATGKFLDGLVAVPGWQSLPLTAAAQAVQRSGFPGAYAKWETQAAQLAAADAGVASITGPTGPQPSACGTRPGG